MPLYCFLPMDHNTSSVVRLAYHLRGDSTQHVHSGLQTVIAKRSIKSIDADETTAQNYSPNLEGTTAMTGLGDLSDSFDAVEVSSVPQDASYPAVHYLKLEYPVCSLLPEGTYPYLGTPTALKVRERPLPDAHDAGVPDSTFFARLPLQLPNPFALPIDQGSAAGLIRAVEAIATTTGTSTLGMVSFRAENEIRHGFSLHSEDDASAHITFILNDEQWTILTEHSSAWTELLDHLVGRASTRAYYHVRNHLTQSLGPPATEAEESRWSSQWNTRPPRGVQQLYYARLFPHAIGPKGLEYMMEGPNRRGLIMHPPCGHELVSSTLAIVAETCETARCYKCSARILQPEDDKEMQVRDVVYEAEKFTRGVRAWRDLDDGEDFTENEGDVEWPSKTVMSAFLAALESLTQPTLISPAEMAVIAAPETREVAGELAGVFATHDWLVQTSPQEFHEAFYGLAAAQGSGPPGWEGDLNRWFGRTMGLLMRRGCWIGGEEHQGVHLHDESLWCRMLSEGEEDILERDDDVVEEGEVASMADLTMMMDWSSLR